MPPSPCIGVCETDAATGLCRGCARTQAEIDGWRTADDAFRDAVWAEIPGRTAAMGLTVRRLSWTAGDILDFVEDTLRGSKGAWVFGVHGASAAVMRAPGEPLDLRRDAETIDAVTPRAALRITAPRATRALAWRERAGEPERILLVLPKGRLGEPGPAALTALGPDPDALLPGCADQPRFDLGLGRAEARVTIRSHDPALTAAAESATGLACPEGLDAIRDALLTARADCVVETPLGRAELALPCPTQSRREADASPTPLKPNLLAEGRATPPALTLPDAYALGCIFYPAR
jgi:predicted Fe-S protein YdhL (DUF1289 family)